MRISDWSSDVCSSDLLGAVLLGQKTLNLAHRHAPGIHRDDLVIKPGKAPFVLGNQNRPKAAVAIPRDGQTYWAIACEHRFGALAIAPLRRLAWAPRASPIPPMVAQHRTRVVSGKSASVR